MESARQIAEQFLDAEVRGRFSYPVVIVEYAVEDLNDMCVFPYNGKAYVEADDWHQATAGNVPVGRYTPRARTSNPRLPTRVSSALLRCRSAGRDGALVWAGIRSPGRVR